MIDLSKLFDQINIEHFNGSISKIPATWNTRLRTAAGYCRYRRKGEEYTPYSIELNKRLFEKEGFSESKIFTTMAHEMTHAYLLEHHNEKGHTANFHSIMTRITGIRKNHRCHNYDTSGLKSKKNITILCPVHGKIGMRARMPKAGLIYKCRSCKSVVLFKRKTSFAGLFD